jgi:hypothetical protein
VPPPVVVSPRGETKTGAHFARWRAASRAASRASTICVPKEPYFVAGSRRPYTVKVENGDITEKAISKIPNPNEIVGAHEHPGSHYQLDKIIHLAGSIWGEAS